MTRTLIVGATVVGEGRERAASVLIGPDGRIDDVLSERQPLPEADTVVEAQGLWLFPGVIDEHVHFREPGLTRKGDMHTESVAALAGGVTTVFDMPNTVPQTTTRAALEQKKALAARSMATNYSFYIGATNDNDGEVLRADYSTTCGVKVFLGSSTGGMLLDDAAALRRLLSTVPARVAAHCEDEPMIAAAMREARLHYGEAVPWAQHATIRGSGACLKSTSLAVALARETGARLHIMHVSTAAEVALLDEPGTDARITGEATPTYLWFSSDDYERLGPLLKCNPSVKTCADRSALRQAVAQGRLCTVGTDHAPHTLEEKTGHGYWQTPSGLPMVAHSLPLMLRLADEGCWSYATVARQLSEAPADLWGVEDRGHVRHGAWADLTLVEKTPWRETEQGPYHCGWTPLAGEQFNHRVVATWVSGQLAWQRGSGWTGAIGRMVRFKR